VGLAGGNCRYSGSWSRGVSHDIQRLGDPYDWGSDFRYFNYFICGDYIWLEEALRSEVYVFRC